MRDLAILDPVWPLAAAALALVVVCSGCASHRGLYEWGTYEDQVYAMYADPGKSSPQQQILKLEADAERARAANRPLPPGYHAYLGYLYYGSGMTDKAAAAFDTERRLFPESAPYMDRLIARTTSR